MTKELKSVLNNKKHMIKTLANREVKSAIREAKKRYRDKVELQFTIKNISSVNE